MLWPHPYAPFYSPTKISVAHALASKCYELAQFVLMDTVCAMIYGLPQIVDYDTSTPVFKTSVYPVQWLHGCPPELQIAFVEINQQFAQRSVLGPEQDWTDIEKRLWEWETPLDTVPERDSCKVVARLAVQESWRHALLVYLYMVRCFICMDIREYDLIFLHLCQAVCGVTSYDPRVQFSVQQIFSLIKSIKLEKRTMVNVEFFIQHMIVSLPPSPVPRARSSQMKAGACTHLETQRLIVHDRLTMSSNDMWIFRGSDYALILDHLWHGAAANGRPIRWNDYVHSRRVILPVVEFD
jgi:hypothetical protein